MENISRQKFLKYLGITGASLLLPRLALAGDQALPEKENMPMPCAPVRMAHLTDIHVEEGKSSEEGFGAALTSVNTLTNKADFILTGGDAIMNTGFNLSRERVKRQWQLFHDILGQNNSLPVRHCIGNHDLYGWSSPDSAHAKSKQWAVEEYKMDRPYYSFEKSNWKFIVLDSIHGRNTIPGYYARLDEAQRNWLEAELDSTPQGNFICIVTHIPILAICTLFDGHKRETENWSIPNNNLHTDAGELTALFYRYPNIKACLSGHIHLIDHVNYLGIDYFCNGAVSGSWWKGNYKQFPPSYSVMDFFPDGTVKRNIHYYNWQSTS